MDPRLRPGCDDVIVERKSTSEEGRAGEKSGGRMVVKRPQAHSRRSGAGGGRVVTRGATALSPTFHCNLPVSLRRQRFVRELPSVVGGIDPTDDEFASVEGWEWRVCLGREIKRKHLVVDQPSNAMTSPAERASAETTSSRQAAGGRIESRRTRSWGLGGATHPCPRADSQQEGGFLSLVLVSD